MNTEQTSKNIFTYILLKLQVNSLDSPEIEQLFAKHVCLGYFCFYILQWFSSTNTNNILIYLNNPFWVNAVLKFHAFCILTAHLKTVSWDSRIEKTWNFNYCLKMRY